MSDEQNTLTVKAGDKLTGIISTTGKGTGFVAIDGIEEDILIEPGNTGLALIGDTVEIELLPLKPGERQMGRVLKVIEEKKRKFVGVIDKKSTTCFVTSARPTICRRTLCEC